MENYLKNIGFKKTGSGCCGSSATMEKWVYGRLMRVTSGDWSKWSASMFQYVDKNLRFQNKTEFENWYNEL